MALRTVGFWWNPQKRGASQVASRLLKALERFDFEVRMDQPLAALLNRPDRAFDERGLSGCDLIATLGGDGTILSGLDAAISLDIPVLGVNLGRVGFLTEVEPDDIETNIERLAAGDYHIEERMLLSANVLGAPPALALNDVVLTRTPLVTRVITFEIYVGGALADRFSGDGLIVSSPTGSTAYSFSAGGPVVVPGLDLFVLTPICAHTLHTRPFVLSDATQIGVRATNGEAAQLVVDGRLRLDMSGADTVMIQKSERKARFIRLNDRSFFTRLRSKLTEWN